MTKTTHEIATEYFGLLAARDLETAAAMWEPGCIDNLVGIAELVAPQGIAEFFGRFFAAVPDLDYQSLSVTAQDDRAAAHWRMKGTFNGTGTLMGMAPNGASFDMLGTDLITVRDGKIVSNTAITNGMEFARQLGILPAQNSRVEKVMFGLVNTVAPVAKAVRARRG